eukprot:COSAG02_NODE_2860_length_7882_cov_7.214442_1_plen_244_part_00
MVINDVAALGATVSADSATFPSQLAAQRLDDHPYRQRFWLDGHSYSGKIWHHQLWYGAVALCAGNAHLTTRSRCIWVTRVADARVHICGVCTTDGTNAMEIWLKPDRNASTCEATLLEQARRVKAAKTGTRVLVYRQALWALSWMESVRAVMYDPAFAGYFLRDKNGAVWKEPPEMSDTEHSQNPAIMPLCTQPAGECAMWNWSNVSARRYFQDVVVGGPRGTGSDLVDGCASQPLAPLPLIF